MCPSLCKDSGYDPVLVVLEEYTLKYTISMYVPVSTGLLNGSFCSPSSATAAAAIGWSWTRLSERCTVLYFIHSGCSLATGLCMCVHVKVGAMVIYFNKKAPKTINLMKNHERMFTRCYIGMFVRPGINFKLQFSSMYNFW